MRQLFYIASLFSLSLLWGCGPDAADPPLGATAQALDDGGNLLTNPGFERGASGAPSAWSTDIFAGATLSWDTAQSHRGCRSVKIAAAAPDDARWIQTINVTPGQSYLLSGWIKTEGVTHSAQSVDAGANLSLFQTWEHSQGVFGTQDWTHISMVFNAGSRSQVTIAARLGYWSGTTTGTAWFDDLRVVPIPADGPHPRWKILALVYSRTDFSYTDKAGAARHVIGALTREQRQTIRAQVRRFVEEDIPALNSGNMIPRLAVRVVDTPLSQMDAFGDGFTPSLAGIAADLDPGFDSVIAIWQPWVNDQATGERLFIGGAAGLAYGRGTGQTFTSIIADAALDYGHLNVFKHEWGHNILSYYEALGVSPIPTVQNHTDAGVYVNCHGGAPYVWADETDASPIPNSIYNNASGFTHDYYSGTTATADQPTRCLGITAAAWATGGPITRPRL